MCQIVVACLDSRVVPEELQEKDHEASRWHKDVVRHAESCSGKAERTACQTDLPAGEEV